MLSGTWTRVTWKVAILPNLMKQLMTDLFKDGIEWKKPDNRNVQANSFWYLQRSALSPRWRQDKIKFTKAKQAFFLISNKADSKVKFVFKEARLYVKRIRPNAKILTSHNEALLKGYPATYNFTRVELKTVTFASGSRSLSMGNAVLGVLPKSLIFTMVKNRLFG